MKADYRNPKALCFYETVKNDMSRFPFAFKYGNREFRGFSPELFNLKDKTECRVGGKFTDTFVYSLDERLQITLEVSQYESHGAVEWIVWFENICSENTDVIEDPHIELAFEGADPQLKGILGDHVNQYRPYCRDLTTESVHYSSDNGRATHINFPYFNLEYGNSGAMLAIGWAGTWSADFVYEDGKVLYTARSVNGMKTYLKAGEKIRTALFVVAPYTVRDEQYATNYWRDWYVKYNLPKANSNGDDLEPFSTCCLCYDTGLPNSDGSISERYYTWRPSLEKMIEEDVKVDFRWFDAGWYVTPKGGSEEVDWWGTVGTWVLDPNKWPGNSFRESTDFARENGMKTLVWFEPERVTDPENLEKNFGYNSSWAIEVEGERAISNNIGNPDCFEWTTERICKMLRDNRVEMYREDNNCNAGPLWKHLDGIEGDGREGITECKLIKGHYDMWDRIIECTLSIGGCGFVDSCASGGGRNDLESMRRGVPLLRSDSDRTSTALRLSMTWGFNKWIPFCGANTREKLSQLAPTGVSDTYVWRASYLPILNVDSQFVMDKEQNFDVLRFGLKEWKKINPYLLKDFYTLTEWHPEKEKNDFTAFCYFDSDKEEGIVLAFRQEDCADSKLKLSIPFASGEDKYLLTDEDSGAEMSTVKDFELDFENPRSAKLLWIKKI